MTSSVDFRKYMNFWYQDKWSGSFPMKLYIIKDVPNTNFRQIILENNKNKAITKGKDAQEVGCHSCCRLERRQGSTVQICDLSEPLNRKPCIPILVDGTPPKFLASKRLETAFNRNNTWLKIFSGTANPSLSQILCLKDLVLQKIQILLPVQCLVF